MFKLKPCDLDFVNTAPWRFFNRAVFSAPPETVFEVISSSELEKEWFPDFVRADWLTGEPQGVGSLRRYELTYMTILEEFLVWEPGKRMAFRLNEMSIPFLRSCLEYYSLIPTEDGGTELLWQVCYDPQPLLRPLQPVLDPFFCRDFRTATAQLTAVVESVHAGLMPRAAVLRASPDPRRGLALGA